MVQGTNDPGNEWSRERKFHHGNECSRERIVLGTNVPAFVHRRTAPLGVPRRSALMHNIGAVMADALLKDTAFYRFASSRFANYQRPGVHTVQQE